MPWVSLIHQYDQPLTNDQLRAQDVKITLDGEAVALSAATITSLLGRSWTLAETGDAVTAHQGGTWTVAVNNSPSEYPLPDSQVTALTPQTNALTNDQLRAIPVPVDTGITQPTTPADTQPISAGSLPLPTGAATAAKQLPDNHQVTVSNQLAQPVQDGGTVNVGNLPATYPNQHSQPLTNAQLAAAGLATEAKQLPDNHSVTVSNQPSDFPDAAAYAARDPLGRYKVSDIEKGAVSYYGFVALSGAWIIMQQNKIAGTFRYTNGASNYQQAWTDRATHSYTYLSALSGL